jgi:hypothetical protein
MLLGMHPSGGSSEADSKKESAVGSSVEDYEGKTSSDDYAVQLKMATAGRNIHTRVLFSGCRVPFLASES